MATASTDVSLESVPMVACVRCAVAAAHPFGHHPKRCPNCRRLRGPDGE